MDKAVSLEAHVEDNEEDAEGAVLRIDNMEENVDETNDESNDAEEEERVVDNNLEENSEVVADCETIEQSQDGEVVSAGNNIPTQEAEVVTQSSEGATLHIAPLEYSSVVEDDDDVVCSETVVNAETDVLTQEAIVVNDSTSLSSVNDSDSTNTANMKMNNHCKNVGRIGPPKRKKVVFDLSAAVSINAVSHKVC